MLVEHRGRAPQIDPSAYVAPTAVVCGDVHIGTDTRVLFGAVLTAEDGEIRVGDRTELVPVGWVAVGDPASIFPPGQHEQIWDIQQALDFPGTVYGITRGTPAAERMSRQVTWYGAHRDDQQLPDPERFTGHGWTGASLGQGISAARG